jgi:hypothetical protein
MADAIDEDVQEQSNTPQTGGNDESQQPNVGASLSADPPPEIIAELRTLIKKFATEEMPNRRHELIRAREQRFFWRGFQYAVYSADSGAWAVPYTGGLPAPIGGDEGDQNRFFYVTNIYTPLGKSLISALVGQVPGVRFLPGDPNNIDDIDGCNEAEKYRKRFYHDINVDQLLKDIAEKAWTDGRVIIRLEEEDDPDHMDENEKPYKRQVPRVYGVLEGKVPISLRWQSEFHYMQIATEQNVYMLKAKWPEKRDKIKKNSSGPGEDAFDRICRLGTMQGTEFMVSGDTYANLATEQYTWIRAEAFEACKDDGRRAQLQEAWPNGVRVCYIGDEFIEAVDENMDDVLIVYLPQPGDGQAVASLGEFVVPIQRRVNNLSNLAQETYERGAPTKFVDVQAIDVDAQADQVASPEMWTGVKRPKGEAMSNLFYKEPPASMAPDLLATCKDLMGSQAQMVSQVQPSLFGGSMVNSKTAAVYAQSRDQAMGALGISYGPLKIALAKLIELAVNMAKKDERNLGGMIPDDFGGYMGVDIDSQKLNAGTYHCKPEVDEGIPESFSQQRQNFQQLTQFIGPTPVGQKLLQDPNNQNLFKKFSGVNGFSVPGADQRNTQLREIKQLLNGVPIPPTQEDLQKVAQHQTLTQVAGHPSPQPQPEDLMQSSVPIDPEFDDHAVHIQTIKDWMYSDEGQQAKILNPKGFMNVRLHAISHLRASTQGPDAAEPLQDRIPDPSKAIAASSAQAAMAGHAQASQPPEPIPEGMAPAGVPPAGQ